VRIVGRLGILLTLAFGFAVVAEATGADAALAANGLVAAYSMDQGSGTTLSDISGTGNAGTLSGATWATAGK
jgi:hypothetical protein